MNKRKQGSGSQDDTHRRSDTSAKPFRGGGGRGPRHGPQKGHKGGADENFIYGFHAVTAALLNPERKVLRLMMTRNAESEMADEGLSLGSGHTLSPEIMTTEEISSALPPGAVHQGIALRVSALPDLSVDEACAGAKVAVVLDQVTDPHNFGAILRSAAVFGAGALITTDRNSPPLGGVLAKAASGALEKVKVAKVTNLVRALEELKDLGFEVIGLDGEGEVSLPDFKTGPKVALVMGAEGSGLRRLTREHCDILARLPATGEMRSLNVSNAAAVALYEISRRG
ncbi:MAG: 23S rRNA (guanosine(2251)-2'-O)-methyltransferase RlmB [Parvibaculum sp.]|nr:23S rRNA (guanosine(2251)-2'-O)-methyltransferase RlmB [Parvibaculum sp.]